MDYIALYGAVLSSVTAVVGGVKWWLSRNPIRMRVTPNMIFVPRSGDNRYLVANVTNRSSLPIVITHYQGEWYSSHWQRLFLPREGTRFIINEPQIPLTLQPGHYCLLQANEALMSDKFKNGGLLYVGISHTMQDKAQLQRVIMKKDAD